MKKLQDDQAPALTLDEEAAKELAARLGAQALSEAETREAQRNLMDRSGERLEVRGPTGGRWRAGFHFTPVPVIIEPGVLTKHKRHQIDTDPLLSVRATDPE